MTASASGSSPQTPIRIEHRADGVAIIWMDVPGEAINTLKKTFSAEFHTALDTLENHPDVRAIVFASGKPDNFLAGADIEMLRHVHSAAEASDLSSSAQHAMNRLADFKIPVVAAIHGPCLGGGLELALACHARVCSDDTKTKLGLPEVQLGLLPGAGGTQRLPRTIGIKAALDLMLTGKQIRARKAKSLGLVDDVVPASIVLDVATKRALRLAEEPEALKRPHETAWFRFVNGLMARNPVGRAVVFRQASRQVAKQTKNHYPAPLKILEVVRIGLEKGMEAGMAAECTAFGELAIGHVAKELMYLFFAQTALKKDTGTRENVSPRKVQKVAMIGAGLMGSGIAYVTARTAKVPVRLKDRDERSVAKGLSHIHGLIREDVKRRRLEESEADQVRSRLSVTTTYTGFKEAQVAIEAVFEDLALKHQILRDVENAGGPEIIFASNTSSLPITRIAEASSHPATVVGMHYFSPVPKMALLEVIVTADTAPWVVATCVALGKKQNKTVIVVNDGVGFYTSRILAPYLNEAAFLLTEGVPIEDIDKALGGFGFPVGPIALLDEVGIDVAEKVGKIMYEAFGERIKPPSAISQLTADQRLGRKNSRGFYVYGNGSHKGTKTVDEGVYAVLGLHAKSPTPLTEISERCVLQMLNEAALCLEEGILRSPRDGDIGAVFGLGFPPFLGGPFRYISRIGPLTVKERLEHYERELGPRFAPAGIFDHWPTTAS